MEINMNGYYTDREIDLYSSYEIMDELIERLEHQDAIKFITTEQINSLYKALWCRNEPSFL